MALHLTLTLLWMAVVVLILTVAAQHGRIRTLEVCVAHLLHQRQQDEAIRSIEDALNHPITRRND